MKRRKVCRWHISEIKREITVWENKLKHARHIGNSLYEAECLKWLHLLTGEIDGIKWVMYGDEPESNYFLHKLI